MLRMRLLAVVLEDVRRQTGTYPSMDAVLHPVGEVLRRPGIEVKDAWGEPLLYRANMRAYELISRGSNKRAEIDHAQRDLGYCSFNRVEDAPDPSDDLVLKCGAFVRRPFGPYGREFTTLNRLTTISLAIGSYAVDFTSYPVPNETFSPVAALEDELVPVYVRELPKVDGWGRPLLYLNRGGTFLLASFGEDGQPDQPRYTNWDCTFTWVPIADAFSKLGGDTVLVCGRPIVWPRGVEP